jgi:hypothetical protein
MGNGFRYSLGMRIRKPGAIAQEAALEAPLIHRLLGLLNHCGGALLVRPSCPGLVKIAVG